MTVPEPSCRFALWVDKPWMPGVEGCHVVSCSNPAIIDNPPTWKSSIRKATLDDEFTLDPSRIIDNADYVAVRGCFCNRQNCPHYVGM